MTIPSMNSLKLTFNIRMYDGRMTISHSRFPLEIDAEDGKYEVFCQRGTIKSTSKSFHKQSTWASAGTNEKRFKWAPEDFSNININSIYAFNQSFPKFSLIGLDGECKYEDPPSTSSLFNMDSGKFNFNFIVLD